MDANGMIKIGPVGRRSEYNDKSWDMRSNQITQVFIWFVDHIILAIQFQFAKDGRLVLSELHGSSTAAKNFTAVKINHPSEYIIELSGQWNTSAITSLTIVTNLQTYGPIGKHFGNIDQESSMRPHMYRDYQQFRFQIGGEPQFGGFHGTANSSGGLKSIGVYLNPSTTLVQPKDHDSSTLPSAKKEKH